MTRVVNGVVLSMVVLCSLGAVVEPMRASISDPSVGESNDQSSPAGTGRAAFEVPRLWEYSAPLIAPEKRDRNPSRAQKDPTVVFYGGKWHVFMTVKLPGQSAIEYCSFEKWEEADRSARTILPVSRSDYYCAPQVFSFTPHQKWYLIYQMGVPDASKMWVAYSTTADIADPNSWTQAMPILDGRENDPRQVGGLDYWIICDSQRAYLFLTSLNGKMWRLWTWLEDFPRGFGHCELALEAQIFEASHTYKLKGMDKYLTIIEENGRRYYKAYLADRLDGPWVPVADTAERPFAGWRNIRPAPGVEPWTDNVSHGELIRDGHDQTLTVDPGNLRLVFQGMWEKDKSGTAYGQFHWRLGLLRPASAVAVSQDYFPPPEGQGGWRTLVPANTAASPGQKAAVRQHTGLDWDRLLDAWTYCTSFSGPHSLLVIRHGWIVGEWHNFTQPCGIASSTKSITGLAMAKAFDMSDRGLLKKTISPDDFAYRYLPLSWGQDEPARQKIWIRHMLTMTSGLTPYDGPYRDEYETQAFAQRVEASPGTVWAYASAPVDLLSYVIEDVTGHTLGDFFNHEIGSAIGASRVTFPAFSGHSGGSGGPGGGAQFRPRDLARVGYLLLHRGGWGHDGSIQQVISAERVARFTQWAPSLENTNWRRPNFAFEPNANDYYGYLFWTNHTQQGLGVAVPHDAFYMSGWGKQICAVIPSLDRGVVRLGPNRTLNEHPDFYLELFSRIMVAFPGREL